ncbi:MAG: RDD family protein [Candidatus Acidiferrales bacterium]
MPTPSSGAVIHPEVLRPSLPNASVDGGVITPAAADPLALHNGVIIAPRPYAGFWLRFVAYLIDAVLLTIVTGVVIGVCVLAIGVGTLKSTFVNINPEDPTMPIFIIGWIAAASFLLLILQWLYFAWMESSEHQGTLGKMALGLIVTDINDQRISFARATGRFFAKIITNYTFLVGYIMAGFTQKKQALHDMIASTLVLRRI